MQYNKIADALLGLSVGDALGVPVEFLRREALEQNPVTGMRAFGSHRQPAGTWSDDSSLAFCLAESLCKGYDLYDLAKNFIEWQDAAFWTAHNEVFDIGIATSQALQRLRSGAATPLYSGGTGERSNGNGSLMRILPLLFYIKDKEIKERFSITAEVSAVTHAHIRSIISCFIYLEFALELLKGSEKHLAYQTMRTRVNAFLKEYKLCSEEELNKFHRILENPIGDYEIIPLLSYHINEISGSGYVLHCLEASIWCFLKTEDYASAVLKAVNLGDDTDTTGCVTGGLAGLYYGAAAIPQDWLEVLARREDIIDLAARLEKAKF